VESESNVNPWRCRELWQGTKKFCINRHRFTKKTTQMKLYPDGRVFRRCRVCQSERDKLRYRYNDERRQQCLARQKKQYEGKRREQSSDTIES
jgi:hypothetical protein